MPDSTVPDYDLECRGVNKHFGDFHAVKEVSFAIPQGRFFSILGPSGCGKTTLLRMLAGFQQPDSGDIRIKGRSVLGTPPNQRPVNMVFQHLALFPNMTVAENVAYGLRRRRVGRAEIERRVTEMLARVGLPDAGPRSVTQLSGGQKQRIAIARCLVLNPDVLLLDEPLGALDLKLREQMKIELKHLQEKFAATFIYITHDQSEALVMSDQVAVMNAGRFEQIGSPQELYYQPASRFVAGFVGESNRWQGRVCDQNATGLGVKTKSGLYLQVQRRPQQVWEIGQSLELYLRPESIAMTREEPMPAGENGGEAVVESVRFDGARSQIEARLVRGEESLQVALPQTAAFRQIARGDRVQLGWSADQIQAFAL